MAAGVQVGGTSVSSPSLAGIFNSAGHFYGSTADELTAIYKEYGIPAEYKKGSVTSRKVPMATRVRRAGTVVLAWVLRSRLKGSEWVSVLLRGSQVICSSVLARSSVLRRSC